jgi:hypothetical protein
MNPYKLLLYIIISYYIALQHWDLPNHGSPTHVFNTIEKPLTSTSAPRWFGSV